MVKPSQRGGVTTVGCRVKPEMDHRDVPTNDDLAELNAMPVALGEISFDFEKDVVWRVGDATNRALEFLRRLFERLGRAIERSVVWPVQDRFALLSGPARAGLA